MFYNIANIARESKFTKRIEARRCTDCWRKSSISILFEWSNKVSCYPKSSESPRRYILVYENAETGLGGVKVKTWSWKLASSPSKTIERVKCEQSSLDILTVAYCMLFFSCFWWHEEAGGCGRGRRGASFCSRILLPIVNMSTFVLLTWSSYSSEPQMFNVRFPTSDQVSEFMIWKALLPNLSTSPTQSF